MKCFATSRTVFQDFGWQQQETATPVATPLGDPRRHKVLRMKNEVVVVVLIAATAWREKR